MLNAKILVAQIVAKTTKYGTAEGLYNLVDQGILKAEDLVQMVETLEPKVTAQQAQELVLGGDTDGDPLTSVTTPSSTHTPQAETQPVLKEKPSIMTSIKDKIVAAIRGNTAAAYEDSAKLTESKKIPLEDLEKIYNPITIRPVTKADFLIGEGKFFAGMNINGKVGYLGETQDPGQYQLDPEMGQVWAVDILLARGKEGARKGMWTDHGEGESSKNMIGMSFRIMACVNKVPDHKFDAVFAQNAWVPAEQDVFMKAILDTHTVASGMRRIVASSNHSSAIQKQLATSYDNLKGKAQIEVHKLRQFVQLKHAGLVDPIHLVGFVTMRDLHKSLNQEGKLKTWKGRDIQVGAITSFALFEIETSKRDRETLSMGPYQVDLTKGAGQDLDRASGREVKAKLIQEMVLSKNAAGLAELAQDPKNHQAIVAALSGAAVEAEFTMPEVK